MVKPMKTFRPLFTTVNFGKLDTSATPTATPAPMTFRDEMEAADAAYGPSSTGSSLAEARKHRGLQPEELIAEEVAELELSTFEVTKGASPDIDNARDMADAIIALGIIDEEKIVLTPEQQEDDGIPRSLVRDDFIEALVENNTKIRMQTNDILKHLAALTARQETFEKLVADRLASFGMAVDKGVEVTLKRIAALMHEVQHIAHDVQHPPVTNVTAAVSRPPPSVPAPVSAPVLAPISISVEKATSAQTSFYKGLCKELNISADMARFTGLPKGSASREIKSLCIERDQRKALTAKK